MSKVGSIERITQNRVVKLFQEELGYTYLGNWEERESNSNIEEKYLTAYLLKKGYEKNQISKAIYELKKTANNFSDGLYATNKNVYQLLRYGADIKTEVGKNTEKVEYIDWNNWDKNDFAIAEEVTVIGNKTKRPDIVIYVNGIVLGVLELKRSTVTVNEGIRQNITNQQDRFIKSFFATVQYLFAGNDTEGLRYGAIKTPEKYYLKWKEDITDNSRILLDKYLLKMCNKERFLEIIYNFIVFDGGVKKLPRVHQYFGVKEAKKHIDRYEGGIIWHTQGSGKSITMVYLAKWILENNPNSRVAILTDRDELDKQIERVFKDADEKIYRTKSAIDLMDKLSSHTPRLLCSLVHKFGKKHAANNFNAFIKDLESKPSQTVGELFVFVDECHRTHTTYGNNGRLHRTMKAMLPNAVFIGFTGTPLLKKDKQTSLEVFGKYIHTYKFNEAVEDGVILDLAYEARDIDQRLTSHKKIDEWFDIKTKGLNDLKKSKVKKKWGTMQKVLSSRSRMERVVADIVFDFSTKPRLLSQKGNAILVSSSIYEACKYYELFLKTPLSDKFAIVTSYSPKTSDVTTEDTGASTGTEKEFMYNLYTSILGSKTAEQYEDWAKSKFINEPANMQLLIVVSKLLTGFDAPSCTYLYIDKSMQDHGLFQAICRVNRLDTEDKEFGCIVDYKELFKKVENAVAVYTSDLDNTEFEAKDNNIMLQDHLKLGKKRLDSALEEIHILCEPVAQPKDTLAYIHYFCGNSEIEEELKAREALRTALYKKTVSLMRAYANIAGEMEEAGYLESETNDIKGEISHYLKLREEIKLASGETLDLKTYEADMRHLIDTYIQADGPEIVSPFPDMPLLDIIVNSGIVDAIKSMPEGIKSNESAIAETIENNVRKKIIKEHLIDPAFFEEMSKLLSEIIKERKEKALRYAEYLKKIAELDIIVNSGIVDAIKSMPEGIKSNESAIAETIENNIRKKIIKEHLIDPAFFEEMSKLLSEIIKERKEKELRYAKYLKKIAELVKKVNEGKSEETPETLTPKGQMALYNNLDKNEELALKIDSIVKRVKRDDWRGSLPKQREIKNALFEVLKDKEKVEKIFRVIWEQDEY